MIRPRVAVLQSNYIPWKGYFDIIGRVDKFVFYDDVQYTKNDWRNRNRIKTSNGLLWLTVPVGANLNRRICDVAIPSSRWQRKHFESIRQAYSKCPAFDECHELLKSIYLDRQWDSLSELNQFVIETISREWLKLDTEFLRSDVYELAGQRGSRLLQLLIKLGAGTYLSGPSAKGYLDESQFERAGIAVEYMDYSHYIEYQQPYPPFAHDVSILDMLVCLGHGARDFIWRRRAGQE